MHSDSNVWCIHFSASCSCSLQFLFKLYLDIFYLLNVHILSQKCDCSNKYSNPIYVCFRKVPKWVTKLIEALAMLHGAIFLATCNAILLLRDVKLPNTSLHYTPLMFSQHIENSSLISLINISQE